MSEKPKVKEFPDIGSKLGAPSKKSVFERHKAEAEAKRQREEEETAAVYEDFVKSFDDESTSGSQNNAYDTRDTGIGRPRDGGAVGGFSRRHFSGAPGRGRNSGPGSLGPPPSASRKRDYDAFSSAKRDSREGLFAFEDVHTGPADPKKALQDSDDEDANNQAELQERSIPKPTLRLSFLPPGTSASALKAIVPPNLTIEGLKLLPPSGTRGADRSSSSAIVTLAKDTPALDIDTAVSALQNRYMGRGFYLSISRHLSSTANLDTNFGLSSSSSSLPFNARPVAPAFGRGAGIGPHRGGYGPPSSYSSARNQSFQGQQVQVTVTPPSDLKQLKLIHKTLEALLTHGPEFEALLMSRKPVQQDEKWAWLWDSRSVGGVYYRWRLWDILTANSQRSNARSRKYDGQTQELFENGALWAAPEQKLPFEYTTEISEVVSDSDYDSSEDDDSGDEGRRRYARYHGGAQPPDTSGTNGPEGDGEPTYLNPLKKAKLIHLLARLPTSTARLRRGDVARVTAFAIQHAGAGADEVVQLITANVHRPFALTGANPDYRSHQKVQPEAKDNKGVSTDTPDPPALPDEASNPQQLPLSDSSDDTTPAKLVALHLISDVLSTSSTSGVRHAWRYRALFETCLRRNETFAHLGRLEKQHNWGRLRAEKWKRSVGHVLGLWEGWCVFAGGTQEEFVKNFEEPPLTEDEKRKMKADEELAAASAAAARTSNGSAQADASSSKKSGRWRSVLDATATSSSSAAGIGNQDTSMTVGANENRNGAPMFPGNNDGDIDDDLDGDPMSEDEDDDDDDENLDGEPMLSSSSASSPAPSGAPAPAAADDPSPPEPETDVQRRTKLAASIAARLGQAVAEKKKNNNNEKSGAGGDPRAAIGGVTAAATTATPARGRKRMRAEDMFAQSDEE